MELMGVTVAIDPIYTAYKEESLKLWQLVEQGLATKDFLKVERFRRIFERFGIDASADKAGNAYLDFLPETVALLDHAVEICTHLSEIGEVGIITNGIESVQVKR